MNTHMESREQKKSKSEPDESKCALMWVKKKKVFAVSAFTIPKNRRQCQRNRNGFMAQAKKTLYIINEKGIYIAFWSGEFAV